MAEDGGIISNDFGRKNKKKKNPFFTCEILFGFDVHRLGGEK